MRVQVRAFWLVVLTLLVAAGLLSCARLVEPGQAFWLQLVAFTPFAIVLYGLVLLMATVRLLVRPAGRVVGGALAVLAAGGLALHCWWFAPLVTGANPPPGDGADPLVVMTSNLHEDAGDAFELVRLVSEADVDLLVVEEVTEADLADMDRAGLADLLPHRVGTAKGLGAATMVFARDELSDPRRIPTLNDGWLITMGDLTLVAVHPHAPTDPSAWRDDHAVLARVVGEAEPDLVVGDLNATADHRPMRALSDAGYRAVGELANEGWQPTWPATGSVRVLGVPIPPLAQIDHVLVGPRLAAISMRTLSVAGSDHRAVVAEVARK